MRYLNFDVWLYRKDGKSYRVRVQGPSEREWAMDSLLPEGALGRRAGGGDPVWEAMLSTPGAGGGAETDPREMGRRLFESIFRGEALACLWASEEEAKTQGASLRIRLRLAETPELAALPWELLYDPARGRFLSRSSRSPIVRFLETPDPYRPLWVEPPLSVLAVLPSPRGMQALAGDEEWRRLQEALAPLVARRLISLDRLDEPTLEGLQGALRRHTVHVAHFVGHGAVQRATGEGGLYFEDRKKNAHFVRGETLGGLFHDSPELRLVMLNACNGARGDRRSVFAGCAQQLILQGVPAVVAMQFPVTDRAAVALAQEFYRSLADGYPVDACVSEARKRLAGSKGREWATPVLFLRAPDGVLFEVGGAEETSSAALPGPGDKVHGFTVVPWFQRGVVVITLVCFVAAGVSVLSFTDFLLAGSTQPELMDDPDHVGGGDDGAQAELEDPGSGGAGYESADTVESKSSLAQSPPPEPLEARARSASPKGLSVLIKGNPSWLRRHSFEKSLRGEIARLSQWGFELVSEAEVGVWDVQFEAADAEVESDESGWMRCGLGGRLTLFRNGMPKDSAEVFQAREQFESRLACSLASEELAKEIAELTAANLSQ